MAGRHGSQLPVVTGSFVYVVIQCPVESGVGLRGGFHIQLVRMDHGVP